MSNQPPESYPGPNQPFQRPPGSPSYPPPPSAFGMPTSERRDVPPPKMQFMGATETPAETQVPSGISSTTTTGITSKPSNYWPLTIIAVFFSIIFGAIGLYFSNQVNVKWKAGDSAGAKKASNTAMIFGIIGIIVGIIFFSASYSGY